jgi:DNA mismatch endonuclease, patch repair protein
MTDSLTPEKRSWNMSRVRSKDTKPERVVRSALHSAGYRFRLHTSELPGKPDIVLPKLRTAIFVNGCFWHQHPGCRKSTVPQNNNDFWQRKLERNVRRDQENRVKLQSLGWKVITLWECQIRDSIEKSIDRVTKCLELTK